MPRRPAVEAVELVKKYRTKERKGLFGGKTRVIEALRGISFKIFPGEVVGLLGPNGAGKTTTIKIISTLLIPDDGKAYVMGYDVVHEPGMARKHLGVMMTVEKGFYYKLTGRENLEYFAALYGLPKQEIRKRVQEVLELVGLEELGASDRLFEEYSLGMKARLNLARALLRDPEVVLLDEPTLGLDPPSARRIRDLVRSLAHKQGKTVLYTTHNMFEAEIVCDRIILINKGRIVAEGTPDQLKESIKTYRIVKIIVRGALSDPGFIEGVVGVKPEVSSDNGFTTIKLRTSKPEEIIGDVIRALVSRNIDIVKMTIEEPTLEDVFLYYSRAGEAD